MIGNDRFNAADSRAGGPRTGIGDRLGRGALVALFPLLFLGCSAAAAGTDLWSPPALPEPSGEEPDGREIIRHALEFMETKPTLAFEALVTYEAVQDNGQKLQFDMLQRVARRMPDKLFWTILFDDASHEMAWCSQGEFILLEQPANIWSRIEVPAAIPEAVQEVSTRYEIDVPFVDILSGDVAELWLGEEVESVEFVDAAWIGGHWTDHVAVRKSSGIDVELWFRQGDEPFPMKIALVVTNEPRMPGYTARFKKWSDTLPENAIPEFTPPADSERIKLIPVTVD